MTERAPHRRRVRRLLAVVVIAAGMSVVGAPAAVPTASAEVATGVPAQDDTTTTMPPVRDGDSPINDILPQPNSGTAPEHPSDRGGWQQFMVFGLLVGGMGTIVLLVWRESRSARRRAQT